MDDDAVNRVEEFLSNLSAPGGLDVELQVLKRPLSSMVVVVFILT